VVLISILTLMNCVCAFVFLAMGAVVVPLFLGLDLAAVTAAFLISNAAARRVERVRVTARAIQVSHETPRSRRVVWESPTAFTRVAVQTEDDEVRLSLALSGRELALAQALSPSERAAFAEALRAAVQQARAERG